MTVDIHQVRVALRRLARPKTNGQDDPAFHLGGQIFQEVFRDLTGPDPKRNIQAALAGASDDREEWADRLKIHAYDRLLGPRLIEHRTDFDRASNRAVEVWEATAGLAEWMAERLMAWADEAPDQDFWVRVTRPADKDVAVRVGRRTILSGLKSSVWQTPDGWVAVEFDPLGLPSTSAEGQIVLYRQLLSLLSPEPDAELLWTVFTPTPNVSGHSLIKPTGKAAAQVLDLVRRIDGRTVPS